MRSVLRRTPAPTSALPLEITVGDLTVSTAARAVTVNGKPVGLTNREFDLLLFFLTHTDTVFSREELLQQVWHWDFGDLSTVTVHVKRLRSSSASITAYKRSGAVGTSGAVKPAAVTVPPLELVEIALLLWPVPCRWC